MTSTVQHLQHHLKLQHSSTINPATASARQRRVPRKLLEEIEIVNAIYGTSTMELSSAWSRYMTCILRFLDQAISYVVMFPMSYPHKGPRLKGIEPAWMDSSSRGKERKTALDKAFDETFVSGSVCIFDAIESIRDLLIPPEKVEQGTTGVGESMDAPARVDIGVMQSKQECAACLDELIIPDLAKLGCKHYLCAECMNCEYSVIRGLLFTHTGQSASKHQCSRSLHSSAARSLSRSH